MKKVEGRRQKENVLRRVLHHFHKLPSSFGILLVRFYQVILSPAKNALLGPAGHCRFEPSCSQYAAEALKTHGAISGSWLAAKRICRCHPWGDFGEDPVPLIKSKVRGPKSNVALPSCGVGANGNLNSKVTVAELQVSNVGSL